MRLCLFLSSLIVTLSPVLSLSADTNSPIAQNVVLTNDELQNLLGISSWRVRLPESLGQSAVLLLERYVDGKRVDVHQLQFYTWLERDSPRVCVVSLREENDIYRFSYKVVGREISSVSSALDLSDTPPHTAIVNLAAPQITSEDIVLAKKIYVVKEGGNLVKTTTFSVNSSGVILFRIAKNAEPKKLD